MDNTMNGFWIALISLLCLFGKSDFTFAQVQVSMTIPNLGSPYLSDYVGNSRNQVLILTNTSGAPQTVALRGLIQQLDRPGYFLRTRENYRPSAPINLAPFETRTLFSNQSDFAFLSENNLESNVPQEVQRNIQATGLLPEGQYQICVRAFDFNTGQPLSEDAPVGCQFFFVTLGSPPQLILPICNDSIDLLFPNFSWTPAISLAPLRDLRYTLYIVEYRSRALNPMEVMEQSILFRGGNPIIIDNIQSNAYQYSPSDFPLKRGSTYIVCIVASDRRNNAMFENKGRSEICMFHIKPQRVNDLEIVKVNNRPPVFSNNPPILTSTVRVSGKLHHRFMYDQSPNIVPSSDQGSNNQRKIIRNLATRDLNPSGNQPPPANNNAGNSMELKNLKDLSRPFNQPFVPISQSQQPLSWNVWITNFSASQPANTDGYLMFDQNPYNSGSFALANTNVSLVEQYILVKNSGSNIADFVPLDGRWTSAQMPVGVSSFNERKLGTVKTDGSGNFSFQSVLHNPCGIVLGGNPNDVVQVRFGSPGADGFMLTQQGKAIIRVLRIIVEDDRYYSPDVMLVAMPGNTLDVGTQTALVKSYKAKIKFTASQGITDSVPLSIKVFRKASDLSTLQPSHPVQEPIDAPGQRHNLDKYFQQPTQGQLLYTTTSSSNRVIEIGNMIAHRNRSSEWYYMLVETPFDGQYNYKSRIIYFADVNVNLFSNRKTFDAQADRQYGHYFDLRFNHQFIEPDYELNTFIQPDFPRIYFQAFEQNTVYTGEMQQGFKPSSPLPNASVEIKYNHPGWAATYGLTDANGKYMMQYTSMYGQPYGFDLQLRVSKAGYFPVFRPANLSYYTIRMGQQWPAEELALVPLGLVELEVEDELGIPAKSHVQFGEGLIVATEESNCSFQVGGSGQQSGNRQAIQIDPPAFGFTIQLNNAGQSLGSGRTLNYLPPIDPLMPLRFDFPPIEDVKRPVFQKPVFQAIDLVCKQKIKMKAPGGNNVPLSIKPMSSQYEDLDTLVNVKFVGETNLGPLVVKFKRKKAEIVVKCGPALPYFIGNTGEKGYRDQICENVNAVVRLHNIQQTIQGLPSEAHFFFQNQGDRFKLQIDAGEEYVPVDEWIYIPGFNQHRFEYILEKAVGVSGVVIDSISRQPIANARVFAINGSDEFGNQYVETRTNANGSFSLGRIDPTVNALYVTSSSSSKTYIGKVVSIIMQQSGLQVELVPLSDWDIRYLFGFPVEITGAQFLSGGNLRLNGLVVGLPNDNHFKRSLSEQVRIPFSEIEVRKSSSPLADGRFRAMVVNSSMPLDQNKYVARLNNVFVAVLHGCSTRPVQGIFANLGFSGQQRLTIFRNQDFAGSLFAMPEVALSSFNFSNEFQGRFYLSEDGEDTRVEVWRAQDPNGPMPANLPKKVFFVGTRGINAMGNQFAQNFNLINPKFSMENFKAFGDRLESRLEGDTFRIKTRIELSVPDMVPQSLNLPVGDILVSPQSLHVRYSSGSISFSLGTWTVRANSWSFEQSASAIKLHNPSIVTKALTVRISDLYLQDNKPPINVSNADLTAGNPRLAGMLDINFNSGAALQLSYGNWLHMQDSSKKIYRLNIHKAGGGDICSVDLSPMLDENQLKFREFKIYSDDYTALRLSSSKIQFYNILPIGDPQIRSYDGFFEIFGGLDLALPNPKADMELVTLRFDKPANQIRMVLTANGVRIRNMPGHVDFTADGANAQTRILSPGRYEAIGTLDVKASPNGAILMSLRGRLIHERVNGVLRTEILTFDIVSEQNRMPGNQKQKIWLGNGGSPNGGHLILENGRIGAQSNDWEKFRFYAAFGGKDADLSFKSGQKRLWYTVHGDIKADDDQSVGVDKVNVSEGGNSNGAIACSVRFDFNQSALIGTFNLKAPPGGIPIGAATVFGSISGGFLFAPAGFYLCASVTEAVVHPVPIRFSSFMLMGSTPSSLIAPEHRAMLFASGGGVWRDLNSFPSCLNEITGIFVAYNCSILDFNVDIDLVVVGVEVDVRVGADLYTFLNFGEEIVVGYGLKVYAGVMVKARILFCSVCWQAAIGVGLGATLSVNVAGLLNAASGFDLSAALDSANATVNGYGEIELSGNICSLVSFSEKIKLGIELSTRNGLNVEFGKSGTQGACIPNSASGRHNCN
jgi:hypothetical protein